MTTSQYFSKLLALSDSENRYKDSDLEHSIIKILSNSTSSFFNLAALFEKADEDREADVINIEIINQIAEILGLLFINPKEREGNVCFANSQDLRPEFKQSFTLTDILDYSAAFLHSKVYHRSDKDKDFVKIPFPKDAAFFWKLVQSGSNWRNKENL